MSRAVRRRPSDKLVTHSGDAYHVASNSETQRPQHTFSLSSASLAGLVVLGTTVGGSDTFFSGILTSELTASREGKARFIGSLREDLRIVEFVLSWARCVCVYRELSCVQLAIQA